MMGTETRKEVSQMETTCNFKRIEKKYLLSEAQYKALFHRIGAHLKPDEYGRSTVIRS